MRFEFKTTLGNEMTQSQIIETRVKQFSTGEEMQGGSVLEVGFKVTRNRKL